MRRLAFHLVVGATALVLLDYVATGHTTAVSAVSPAFDQSAAVNRVTKGDRQDRGGASVQLKVIPPQTSPLPGQVPQPVRRETKMLEGCELAVSPLAEFASSGSPARCVS